MTKKPASVDLGKAKIVGVGLKMAFQRNRNFLIWHPKSQELGNLLFGTSIEAPAGAPECA
jgi:hypothetical protein